MAGTGNSSGDLGDGGPATAAFLNIPNDVVLDAAGNLYIADSNNHRVRKVAAGSGIITTFAGTGQEGSSGDGGPATMAALALPLGLAVDAAGNIYIADRNNNRVRKVAAGTGIITTIAGVGTDETSGDGGPATLAGVVWPWAVSLDRAGNLYITQREADRMKG